MTAGTQTSDNSKAIGNILANIVIFSFFPLFSMLAVETSGIFTTLFYSQVAGFIVTAPFARRKALSDIKTDILKAPILLMVMSGASLFIGMFFLLSVTRTSGITATLALELWPLFAMIFGAFFIKKDWGEFSPFHVVLFLAAGSGVLLLAYVENADNAAIDAASFFSFGVLLAVLSSVASGATVVQTQLYYTYEDEPSLAGACYTIMLIRAVALVPTFALALYFGEDLTAPGAMIWGGLLGVTAYGAASVLAIIGLRYSSTLLHFLLWFLSPVLATTWLILFLDQRLTDLHIIAFMPILLANIFSSVRRIRRRSFFVMSVFSLLAGVAIYAVTPSSDLNYFDSLGVVVSAYAIIVSFILQRKLSDIRELGMELVNAIQIGQSKGHSQSDTVDAVFAFVDPAQSRPTLIEAGDGLETIANRIKVERATSFVSAEAIVLCVLTAAILVIALCARTPSLIADVTAFAISVTAVFLTIFSIECSSPAFQWRIAKEAVLNAGGTSSRINDSVFLSIAGTVIMIVLLAILLIDKWVVDIIDTILN
ncbi:MAG: DMT family transporter [Octadecabacter sp.]